MNKRTLPAVLLMLLIAMQSVVASADVHALFDTSSDHNDLALEHSHGDNTPVHGHTNSDTHNTTADQITDLDPDTNCEHCCHCHNPSPASTLVKGLQAHNDSLDQQSLRTTYQQRSELYSPAFRPPIATV